MGAAFSQSFSSINILNECLTEILLQNSNNCSLQQHTNQQLTFKDMTFSGCDVNFNNISQTTNLSANLACAQDTTHAADLQSKFENALNKKLESAIKQLNLGLNVSQSAAITNLKNVIKNTVSVTNIAQCIGKTIANQKQTFSKINFRCNAGQTINFQNIKQEIILNSVAKCTQTNETVIKATNKLDNIVKEAIVSTIAGINPFMASLGMMSSLIPIMIVACILLYMYEGTNE